MQPFSQLCRGTIMLTFTYDEVILNLRLLLFLLSLVFILKWSYNNAWNSCYNNYLRKTTITDLNKIIKSKITQNYYSNTVIWVKCNQALSFLFIIEVPRMRRCSFLIIYNFTHYWRSRFRIVKKIRRLIHNFQDNILPSDNEKNHHSAGLSNYTNYTWPLSK